MELSPGLGNFLSLQAPGLPCSVQAALWGMQPVSVAASLFPEPQVLALNADTFWSGHHSGDGEVL